MAKSPPLTPTMTPAENKQRTAPEVQPSRPKDDQKSALSCIKKPISPMRSKTVRRAISADQPLPSIFFAGKITDEKGSASSSSKSKSRPTRKASTGSQSPNRSKNRSLSPKPRSRADSKLALKRAQTVKSSEKLPSSLGLRRSQTTDPAQYPIPRQPRPQCPIPPGILRSKHAERSSQKRVSFDNIEVREYPMTLDASRKEEPVMLTLSWDCVTRGITTVQNYDSIKARNRKRTGGVVRKYKLPERAGILLGLGFDMKDLGRHLNAAMPSAKGEDPRKTAHPSKKKAMFSMMKDPARAGIVKM